MRNPLGPPPPTVKTIGDVNTGKVYHSPHRELWTKPNDVLCPFLADEMYLYHICIDQHGLCSLEPGYATLGTWNLLTKNKADSWWPLGSIPPLAYIFCQRM
jgi:hypothetical protein